MSAIRYGGRLGLYSAIFLVTALVVTLLVARSMLRRPVLRRMGLRNVTRRKWNTTLVVMGSMVGTALISGSLVLNDSTGRFQENQARQALGEIDEVVGQSGQRLPGDRRPAPFFDASVAQRIPPESVREGSTEEEPASPGVFGVLQRATTYASHALGAGEGPVGVDGVL